MNDRNSEPLRQRRQRTTRTRIIDAAIALFDTQGFAHTTVDQIAEAAEVSPRTFFRYFGTKEAVVFNRADEAEKALVKALESRPCDEPAWVAIRHAFNYFTDPASGERTAVQESDCTRIIEHTEELRIARLLHQERLQSTVASALLAHAERSPSLMMDQTCAESVTRAAFSCLTVAYNLAQNGKLTLSEALDTSMARLVGALTA